MNEQSAITVIERNGEAQPPGIIRPLASPQEAVEAWQQFQALKVALLTDDDYQQISGKRFVKKSGWRRIAAAFGIECQILREERRDINDRVFVWELTARAIAPNGRAMDGTGSCASDERRFAHVHHDVRAMAETRAKNRAIADLVAGGEVSADEVRAEATLSREQANELIAQFERSCDQQGVAFDHRTLATLLLQHADDLRRAFKHFKAQGTATETAEEAADDE